MSSGCDISPWCYAGVIELGIQCYYTRSEQLPRALISYPRAESNGYGSVLLTL
jgi:hypothetical protein